MQRGRGDLPAMACSFRVAGAGGGNLALRHNKRMHATADTEVVKFLRGAGRRVMRSVGLPES
ncbi:MAG: hypothetical protein LC754_04020 [Acidobacteria bacterium]|nr:hypothetical protein [Acidobacteriota bacterium]